MAVHVTAGPPMASKAREPSHALPSQLIIAPALTAVRRLPHDTASASSCSRRGRCFATSKNASGSRSEEARFQSPLPVRDFYELLGVAVEASAGDIRQAYWTLQKKHHPDIVGQEGHAMTLLLNEAYRTLMDETLRNAYNKAHSYSQTVRRNARYATYTGSLYSSWVGPDRPEGIFVDENVCVGCRECVHVASNTFTMDDNTGCARVKAQWADSDSSVKAAREVCPVNCIHLVAREDLPALEYLIQPQPKESNGVYGGGWERTRNVFMAAATLKRQMAEKTKAESKVNEETPAQKAARMQADFQIRMGPFWKFWAWTGRSSPPKDDKKEQRRGENASKEGPKIGLFGRSSTSDILILPLSNASTAQQAVGLVQEWATTFASTSELPLPMPFRTDVLPNGVQLSLITASSGTIKSIGSLVVTVEQPSAESEGASQPAAAAESTYLRIRREGTTGTSALPGEGRIVKILKQVVLGRDTDYSFYRLPRM